MLGGGAAAGGSVASAGMAAKAAIDSMVGTCTKEGGCSDSQSDVMKMFDNINNTGKIQCLL